MRRKRTGLKWSQCPPEQGPKELEYHVPCIQPHVFSTTLKLCTHYIMQLANSTSSSSNRESSPQPSSFGHRHSFQHDQPFTAHLDLTPATKPKPVPVSVQVSELVLNGIVSGLAIKETIFPGQPVRPSIRLCRFPSSDFLESLMRGAVSISM